MPVFNITLHGACMRIYKAKLTATIYADYWWWHCRRCGQATYTPSWEEARDVALHHMATWNYA